MRSRNKNASTAGASLLERPQRTTADDAERRGFVEQLAHEIRGALAGIKNYTEILLDFPPADLAERRAFLKAVGDEADRLNRLLGDVTDLERLARPESLGTLVPLELRVLAERACLSVHPLAARKQVHIAFQSDSEPRITWGNPRLVERAIAALIENAVKFSMLHGQVSVELLCDSKERAVAVSVTDRGIGVDPGHADAIFAPFHQAAVPPDTISPRGSGIGLTLAWRIAERHGGSLSHCARGAEPGSRFTITFPC